MTVKQGARALWDHYRLTLLLIIVGAIAVGANVRVEANSRADKEEQDRVNVTVCISTSEFRESMIHFVTDLTPMTPHIAGETPEQAARIDKLNQDRQNARDKAHLSFPVPKCLQSLNLDTDKNGLPDPDKIPNR